MSYCLLKSGHDAATKNNHFQTFGGYFCALILFNLNFLTENLKLYSNISTFPKVDVEHAHRDLKNPSKRRIFCKGDKQFLNGTIKGIIQLEGN